MAGFYWYKRNPQLFIDEKQAVIYISLILSWTDWLTAEFAGLVISIQGCRWWNMDFNGRVRS